MKPVSVKVTQISEEFKQGRIEGVFVTEDSSILKYRIAYIKRRRDEWIRFDHRLEESSHIHIRVRTPIRVYDEIKRDMVFLLPIFEQIKNYFGGA